MVYQYLYRRFQYYSFLNLCRYYCQSLVIVILSVLVLHMYAKQWNGRECQQTWDNTKTQNSKVDSLDSIAKD